MANRKASEQTSGKAKVVHLMMYILSVLLILRFFVWES